MNPRPYLSILITLVLLCSPFINAHAQTTLSPTDHCREFSADAIVTFADPSKGSEYFDPRPINRGRVKIQYCILTLPQFLFTDSREIQLCQN